MSASEIKCGVELHPVELAGNDRSMSCHAPHLDAVCNRAGKDIESTIEWMSAALAGSVFERLGVAENRLLMQPLTSTSRFATSDGVMLGTSIWDQCDSDIWKIYGALVRAMKEASLAAVKRGDDTYINQWLAAWVSSPVSARLLHAMQTLMDGCIFQVKGAELRGFL